MPFIKITTAPITNEIKSELLVEITASVHSITKIPKQFIQVVINEVSEEHYAVAGETVSKLKKSNSKGKSYD